MSNLKSAVGNDIVFGNVYAFSGNGKITLGIVIGEAEALSGEPAVCLIAFSEIVHSKGNAISQKPKTAVRKITARRLFPLNIEFENLVRETSLFLVTIHSYAFDVKDKKGFVCNDNNTYFAKANDKCDIEFLRLATKTKDVYYVACGSFDVKLHKQLMAATIALQGKSDLIKFKIIE